MGMKADQDNFPVTFIRQKGKEGSVIWGYMREFWSYSGKKECSVYVIKS